MGAMDLDDWRVTALEKRNEGETFDCSHGAKAIMKTLHTAGIGTDNPHPPFQVALRYTGKIVDVGGDAADLVFDDAHAETPVVLDIDEIQELRFGCVSDLCPGLALAIRSFREGERATVRVWPEKAFGAAGKEALGIPADATLEFDVTLVRIIAVNLFHSNAIVKRRLYRRPAEPHEKGGVIMRPTPQLNAEVTVRWSAMLSEDDFPIRDEAVERFWLGDPSVCPWWRHVLSSFQVRSHAHATCHMPVVAPRPLLRPGSLTRAITCARACARARAWAARPLPPVQFGHFSHTLSRLPWVCWQVGESAEMLIDAEAAYGDEGSLEYEVHAPHGRVVPFRAHP